MRLISLVVLSIYPAAAQTPTPDPVLRGTPNVIAGCQILPLDSIYNTRVDNAPVHESSAAWIKQTLGIGRVGLSMISLAGFNIVDNSTPVARKPKFHYSTVLDGKPFVFAPPPVRFRETGSLTTDGVNDHHLISINHQTCQIYESYQDTKDSSGQMIAASAYTYSSTSYKQPSHADGGGTTDAAGLPLTPLLLHLSEIQAGRINHALRFTSCAGCISHAFLWPAISSTAYAVGAAPMGSRWRLKASFDMSKYSAKAQVILTALEQFGMILADVGGMQQLTYASDMNRDPTTLAALAEIAAAKIDQNNFEVVDTSGWMRSTNSHQVKGDAVPQNVRVTIGARFEHIFVQSGQSIALPVWVNGAADQTVTWTATEGKVTDGSYTAPPVTAPLAVSITATAAADPVAKVTIHAWILPAGPIRIDVGSPKPYTDTAGHLWYADNMGFDSGFIHNTNDFYPSSNWTNVKDAHLWQTGNYTYGDDIVYGPIAVPNGTYVIKFGFSRNECSGTYNPAQTFNNALTPSPVALEANGEYTVFNVAAAENNTCRTPALGSVSAIVSNNLLTVAVRALSTEKTQSAPYLNSLEIAPAPRQAAGTQNGKRQ